MKNLFKKIILWAMKDENAIESDSIAVEDRCLASNGLKLEVFRANGGIVIETRRYISRKDENQYSIHVITDDKDLGQELGKIISYESLHQ